MSFPVRISCPGSSCFWSKRSWAIETSCISCWKGLPLFSLVFSYHWPLYYAYECIYILFTGWLCTVGCCKSEKPPWGHDGILISQASAWSFLCSSCPTLATKILLNFILPKVNWFYHHHLSLSLSPSRLKIRVCCCYYSPRRNSFFTTMPPVFQYYTAHLKHVQTEWALWPH